MHNILMILRREYRERVAKKSFWIGAVVLPVFLGGLIVGSIMLMSVQPEKQRKIAFIDATFAGVLVLLRPVPAGDPCVTGDVGKSYCFCSPSEQPAFSTAMSRVLNSSGMGTSGSSWVTRIVVE